MMKPICIFLLLLANAAGYAQWSNDPSINNVVCNFSGSQTNVQMISDGAGGAILTWEDTRNSIRDIYAQGIDANGLLKWNVDGIAICTATSDQYSPRLVSDNAGGAIITWYDNRAGNYDIYAQRINSVGVVQWTTDGVVICNSTGNQNAQQLMADGSGGAIIVWSDGRVGGPSADIMAQRINASGTVQWTTNGVSVCNANSLQNTPQLVSDGAGGAIISWEDWRSFSQPDIYAQRISSNGFTNWSFNGVVICSEPNLANQYSTKIVSDGAGGAIISWLDQRNFGSSQDIYAQKVNASGIVQWVSNGVAVCNAPALQTAQQMITDGSGGTIITWEDRRTGNDIYAQQINTSGVAQWTANGLAVCSAGAVQNEAQIVPRASGGAIIIWTDLRNNFQEDIYAQAVTLGGVVLWPTDGIPVANESHSQLTSSLISDGADGAIIAWQDLRTTADYDIYSSKLFANGTLPLKLISFTAALQNKNALLQWQTADEQNIAKFNLQRSRDGVSFTTIGTVNSAGNSATTKNYRYTDYAVTSINSNAIYYRLQIADEDGKTSYSKIEIVKPVEDLFIQITPNPARDNIIISSMNTIRMLSVLDTKGQMLKTISLNGIVNQIKIDVKDLPPGIYFIKAVGENQQWVKQFIKE